jgi:hypothetical protein
MNSQQSTVNSQHFAGVELVVIGRNTYHLERLAVSELQQVKRADVADAIFNRFAPIVPAKHRLAVWRAVDTITL